MVAWIYPVSTVGRIFVSQSTGVCFVTIICVIFVGRLFGSHSLRIQATSKSELASTNKNIYFQFAGNVSTDDAPFIGIKCMSNFPHFL